MILICGEVFLLPLVLSFKNHDIHNRAAQNICIEQNFEFGELLILNPATEQSCLVFNKLTWHEPAMQSEKHHLVSGQLHKNTNSRLAVILSPRYGHMMQVSGYLVSIGVN